MTTGRLAGRRALVTGAAGDIGAAIVDAFRAEGARVLATDMAAPPAAPAAPADFRQADLAEPGAARDLVDACLSHLGGLDILVNNAAAVTPRADVTALDDADWARALDVNLSAPMRLCRAAIPVMAAAGGGVVVNVASQLGRVPTDRRIAYGTSKAALLFMTRLMALDHAADGIRVNSLSPGPVATGRLAASYGSAEEAESRLAVKCPVGRIGRPAEVAAAAVFLAGPEGAFITGTDLLVDGGFSVAAAAV